MTTNPATHLPDARMYAALNPMAGGAVRVETSVVDAPLDYVALAHVPLRPVLLDVTRLAGERVERLRALEPDRHVVVIVHLGMAVSGDAVLLSEALTRLIDNAWTATAESRGAWIEIGTRMACDGERQFYVADNGAGFDMALAGTLFEPPMSRYRVESVSGPGKGLARAARIIRRHAGRLEADSAPGMGAEFYFTVGAAPGAGTLDS